MHVVEKTTVVLTSVHRVHRVLKFTMDFVPCKLHGDDRGDNTVTTRGQPGDNTDTGHSNNDTRHQFTMSAPLSVTQLQELLMWGHWDAAQACWVTSGPWANSDLNSIQGTCVRREMVTRWITAVELRSNGKKFDTWMRVDQYLHPPVAFLLECCAKFQNEYDTDHLGFRTCDVSGFAAAAFGKNGWWQQLQAIF